MCKNKRHTHFERRAVLMGIGVSGLAVSGITRALAAPVTVSPSEGLAFEGVTAGRFKCSNVHSDLSKTLRGYIASPKTSEEAASIALRSCSCPHCGTRIMPAATF